MENAPVESNKSEVTNEGAAQIGASENIQGPSQPGTSGSPPQGQNVKRSRSEPNYDRYFYIIKTETTTLNDETPTAHERPAASKFSLRFKSEILNFRNRSNVTLKSSIRVRDPSQDQVSGTSTRGSIVTQQPSGINAEITVLYSDNASYTSSESLVAKDSMGYHLADAGPVINASVAKSTTAIRSCISQPPPYHVATAYDTCNTVQITPAAAPPLVLYSAPPLHGAPPTYSALMRVGPRDSTETHRFSIFSRRDVRIQPSAPFIAPPPPPSYAQAQGYCVATNPLQCADLHESTWGTEPVTIICPFCNNFVVTSIHFRRSNLTHYSALALCICGCWPCCLLPYCMKSCKSVQHECPICTNVVGVYSPWQVT